MSKMTELLEKAKKYQVTKAGRGKSVYSLPEVEIAEIKKALKEKIKVVLTLEDFKEIISWSGKAKSQNMLWTVNGGANKGDKGLTQKGLLAQKITLAVNGKEIPGIEISEYKKEDKTD